MSKRFLHLERDRPSVPDREERPDNGEEVALPTGLNRERFRPEPEPSLAVAAKEEGPGFLRCARCGADNTRFARNCARCETPLHTPEQRAYNAQFAERLTAERKQENETLATRRAEQERLRAEEAAQLREAQLELGKRLAQRERERVEDELGDGGFTSLSVPGALRRIQSPRARLAVLVALGLVAVLPWFLTSVHSGVGEALRLVSLMVLLSFTPPGWRRNRRFRGRWRW
jgi:hypothetical protein